MGLAVNSKWSNPRSVGLTSPLARIACYLYFNTGKYVHNDPRFVLHRELLAILARSLSLSMLRFMRSTGRTPCAVQIYKVTWPSVIVAVNFSDLLKAPYSQMNCQTHSFSVTCCTYDFHGEFFKNTYRTVWSKYDSAKRNVHGVKTGIISRQMKS